MVAPWIERRFERLIWKFRLISIVPVLLSLLGSVGCFVIGAIEVFKAFLVIMGMPFSTKSLRPKRSLKWSGRRLFRHRDRPADLWLWHL